MTCDVIELLVTKMHDMKVAVINIEWRLQSERYCNDLIIAPSDFVEMHRPDPHSNRRLSFLCVRMMGVINDSFLVRASIPFDATL